MKILFVTEKFPYPLTDGGNIRSFNILRLLAKEHQVTLLSGVEDPQEAENCPALESLCGKIKVFPQKKPRGASVLPYILLGLVGDIPYPLCKNFSQSLLSGILCELSTREYQAVHFNHLDAAQYLLHFPSDTAIGNPITVLDTHNVLSLILHRFRGQERFPWKTGYIYTQWKKMKSLERRLCERMRLCLVCSNQEAEALQIIAPQAVVEVVPNGVDTSALSYRPLKPEAGTHPAAAFIGNLDYLPNEQALHWFSDKALPLVEDKMPEIEFYIAGRHTKNSLQKLARKNVHLLGNVESFQQVMQPSWILVVPIHVAGGTRIKILEAMSLGLPVVSTTIGAEGLEVSDREHLLLADTPTEMARGILELCQHQELWQHLIQNARQLVTQKYDWETIGQKMLLSYSQLQFPTPTRRKER